MRGLTFQGTHDVRVEEVPDPTIEHPGDAIVRVTMAGICGSDLHIYNAGEAFGFAPGSRLGHEFIGTVEAVGPEVTGIAVGDRVMSSCSVACGECTWCREGLASSCVKWSLFGWAPRVWAHGGAVQGGQSELVRVPLAASTLHPMPESLSGADREATVLPLVDVMSTGWHGLTSAGAAPGQSVVVIGDGAVGLAGVHGAKAKGAERIICLGHHADRLATATALGATLTISSRDDDEIKEAVMEHTGGEGAHVVVNSISGPGSMATAHATVRPGGTIACLGMDHFMGKTPSVNWFDQFLRNISVTGGLVPGKRYFPELLALVESGKLDPAPMLSHQITLDEAADGYKLMAERAEGVTKVALRPGGMTVQARLEEAGQGHLAVALERLEEPERSALEAEIEALDLGLVRRLVDGLGAEHSVGGAIAPPDPASVIALPRDAADEERDRRARAAGEDLLRAGGVAAVLLAGGQGTRLGYDGPKGLYPFAPLSGRTLFSHHAAKIAALRARYGAALPWYVLTSPANDAPTRQAFADAGNFGLEPGSVRLVMQGTLPAVDRATGEILLAEPGHLALSPDGHGGLLSALAASGALDEMTREGVRTIFTFQVDNPLARVCRPELLGHHVLAGADMSSVVVRKLSAEEKMGVIARVDGLTGVVEYSDLPDALARERDAEGELVYWAGSIAVHCIEVGFARRLTEGGLRLPYHHAVKKVPYVDADGRAVEPDEPNAVKFETFLFDALPSAGRTVTVEAAREDEFSPIKNAEGADSPASARRDLNRLYARWLEAAGVPVPRDPGGEPVDLEIDPRVALEGPDLAAGLPEGFTVEGPTVIGPPGS